MQAADVDERARSEPGQYGRGRAVHPRAAHFHHRLPRQQTEARAGPGAVRAAEPPVASDSGELTSRVGRLSAQVSAMFYFRLGWVLFCVVITADSILSETDAGIRPQCIHL